MFKTLVSSAFSKTEMPSYKVVSKNDVYEERAYDEGKWVITTVTGKNYKDASSEGFLRLFKYIAGTNQEAKNVAMTSPVCIHVTPGDSDWKSCKEEIRVGFFLPPGESSDSPPTPNDDSITIRPSPTATMYVRQFGGFAGEKELLEELAKLRLALGPDQPYVEEFFYFCGYDSPMKLMGRRNEVWLLKK